MSAHSLPQHICPYCLKRFETRQAVQAHQKAKRHTVAERQEGGNYERRMRAYDHLRRKQQREEAITIAKSTE